MIYYAIRHIRTGELMPEVRTRGGYSHWNPDNSNMPIKIFFGHPRLFETRKRAIRCISQWVSCQNGRRHFNQNYFTGECDDSIDIKLDGRKKEDLEVVKVVVIVKRNDD